MQKSVIKASVGAGPHAVNRSDDVLIVQQLLNKAAPAKPLQENGRAGPALTARIKTFQFGTLHFRKPDGRVDPGGLTIKGLVRHHGTAKIRAPKQPEPSMAEALWNGIGNVGSMFIESMTNMFSDDVKARQLPKRASPATSGGKSVTVTLTDRDYAQAASRLGTNIDPALLRAFAEVESGGKPALGANGLPVIAYEGHIFRKYSHRRFDRDFPLLSYPYKRKAGPEWQVNNKTQKAAWETLDRARALDHRAALMGCSWGMFQVMGFNYQSCGYRGVDSFVQAMKGGARGQLDAFVGFCRATPGMVQAMQRRDYVYMASHYNGKDHGNYDTLIQKAHKRLGAK